MFARMNRWLALQRIHPVIDRVVAFEDAPQAYAHQVSGTHFGKVVIARP
jgi:NADPH:quinone reductase-like Zn-dependent oxidoreductase